MSIENIDGEPVAYDAQESFPFGSEDYSRAVISVRIHSLNSGKQVLGVNRTP